MLTVKRSKSLQRLDKWRGMSRAKVRRIMDRYDRWLLYRLSKYGPGREISNAERIADRRMQIAINEQNRRNEDE